MTNGEMQRHGFHCPTAKINAAAEAQKRDEDRWTRTEESIHELL
jgi:hypothetical protein